MSKLVSMGELLIDFQSKGSGSLKDTAEFVKKAGGAPANVCVQAARLGCAAVYLTQVGADGFGEFLIETLKTEGVDTSYIKRSDLFDTSLAFVSFKPGGEREFSFYRRTAADLFFSAADFEAVKFERGDVFEFGSVALATKEARLAHDAVIKRAKAAGAVICFDPNVRLNLWRDAEELKSVILDYAKYADVIKLGDDELEFVTGIADADKAVKKFLPGAKLVAVTRGARGAKLYRADGETFDFSGVKVDAVDTTGAGDSFFGGFIAEIMRLGATVDTLDRLVGNKELVFACKCGSYTSTGFGAMSAMGTRENIEKIGG